MQYLRIYIRPEFQISVFYCKYGKMDFSHCKYEKIDFIR